MKITLISLRNAARPHGWEIINESTAVETTTGQVINGTLEEMAIEITKQMLDKRNNPSSTE